MDVALAFKDMSGDITVSGGDLTRDMGLETAVVLSLFLDREAHADDALPDGSADRRGWWADAYAGQAGDRIGSRLWLLSREKQLPSVLARAKEYAEEALAWLVEDGVARSVEVTAEWTKPGMLGLLVRIKRPDGARLNYRFDSLWRNQ